MPLSKLGVSLRSVSRALATAVATAAIVLLACAVPAAAQLQADAGPNQEVTSGETVTLDASGSTGATFYAWSAPAELQGMLGGFDHNSATPSFTAPTLSEGETQRVLTFSLLVSNDNLMTSIDMVTITVVPVVILQADAGFNQAVASGETVTLNASGSIGATFIAWSAPAELQGMLGGFDHNSATPSFTAPTLSEGETPRVLTFTLLASNDNLMTSFDTVTITVYPQDVIAIANAGPDQRVASGAIVTLDGSMSLNRLSSQWETRFSDPIVFLSLPFILKPTFTAPTLRPTDQPVELTFGLSVSNTIRSHYDTVTITVLPPPIADPGPHLIVASGETVTLDGSQSLNAATYFWEHDFTCCPGGFFVFGAEESGVELSDPDTAQQTFTANILQPTDLILVHQFRLTVTNGLDPPQSDDDTVVIRVHPPPSADAGPDQVVSSGTEVTLPGSGTSPPGTLNYLWERIGGTSTVVPTLHDAGLSHARFDADTLEPTDEPVTHMFRLTVMNSVTGKTAADTVKITIHPPPTANAGADQIVTSGAEVTLAGSGSALGSSQIVETWERASGTGNDPPTNLDFVTDAAGFMQPTFTADNLQSTDNPVTHVFRLTVTNPVSNGAATDEVRITVEPPDAPTADAGQELTVSSGTTVTLSGIGTSPQGTPTYLWERIAGTSTETPILRDATTAQASFNVEPLSPGVASTTHVFQLTVTNPVNREAVTDTVTITVAAPPVANGGQNRTVASNAAVTLDAGGSVNAATYEWTRIGGSGSASVFPSSLTGETVTFTTDALGMADNLVTHEFQLTVADIFGRMATDTVTISVTAEPVAIAGLNRTVASNASVILDASGSVNAATYEWTRIGGSGSASVFPGPMTGETVTFTTDALGSADNPVTHEFQLMVEDVFGRTATDTVIITVDPPPDADAGLNQTVDSGMAVTLDGSASTDIGGGSLAYAWERTGGTNGRTVSLSNAATAQPTFDADTLHVGVVHVTHEITLTVTDTLGQTDTDTVTVTIEPPLIVANAGPDQVVNSGAEVRLDARGSMGATVYQWVRNTDDPGTGAPVTLTNDGGTPTARIEQPRFVAETLAPGADPVTYRFTLHAGKFEVGSQTPITDTDEVMITVDPPPLAEAGPARTVDSGKQVILDGSASTDDNAAGVTYLWERIDGTGNPNSVFLSDTAAEQPTFDAETLQPGANPVTHKFQLTVMDSRGQPNIDTVIFTVDPPPVANAGMDQIVAPGFEVTLDGTASTDNDGGTLNYAWERTGGTIGRAVSLRDADTAHPTFDSDTHQVGANSVIHEFTLTVTDARGQTDTDTVVITVDATFTHAYAGLDQVVSSGEAVTLDGSGSRNAAQFSWQQTFICNPQCTVPFGAQVTTLSDSTAVMPTFTADALQSAGLPVVLIFELTVTNILNGTTDTDTVQIKIYPQPTADAGLDRVVASGTEVTLSGQGNVPIEAVAYQWERIGGTSTVIPTLRDATTAQARFDADILPSTGSSAQDVTHEFRLTVRNLESGQMATDDVTITVIQQPTANAGPDRDVASGSPVTLDGSGSMHAVTYSWMVVGGSVTLSDADTAGPTFTAPTLDKEEPPVDLTLRLTVRNRGLTAMDEVTITFVPPPRSVAGPHQMVGSGETVTLDGSQSVRAAAYLWEHTSTCNPQCSVPSNTQLVTLSDATTERPTFTADILQPTDTVVRHQFRLTVMDNFNPPRSDTSMVEITIQPPPSVDAGQDQMVASGTEVVLSGQGSATTGAVSYLWERIGGTSSVIPTLRDAGFSQARFDADTLESTDAPVTHVFRLTVTNTVDGGTATNTVTITVVPPPSAIAGTNQIVTSGETVTLDGSSSLNAATYQWGQIVTCCPVQVVHPNFPTVTLSGNNAAQVSFTADILQSTDQVVEHVFELRVTDGLIPPRVDIDTVTITINPPDAPTANAGDDQDVVSGATVTLSGAGTVPGGGTPTYAWTAPQGVSFTDGADTATPIFTAPEVAQGSSSQDLVFTLRVTNPLNNEAVTDTITITVLPLTAIPVELPLAEAGMSQTAASGETVTLDGSGSMNAVTYLWEHITASVPGRTVTLGGADTAMATFSDILLSTDNPVIHTFRLTVTDNSGRTDTDNVNITITPPGAPTAVQGLDQIVNSGAEVTLAGSGTAPGGSASYLWSRSGGTTGRTVSFVDNTDPQTTFIADTLDPGDANVIHELELRVTNSLNSEAVTSPVVIITVDAPPLAEAGPPQSVLSGKTVTLTSAGSSDTSGGISTYSWVRSGGSSTTTPTLTGANAATASFTADALSSSASSVTHVFTLTVTDARSQTHTDTVTITINPPGATTADAGNNQTVASGADVSLTGSGTAPGGSASYAWIRTGGSGGTWIDVSTAQASFTAPTVAAGAQPETHVFRFTVTNSLNGDTATDTVSITVNPQLPVAEAGPPQSVVSGETVTLTSAGSTGGDATYAWARAGGTSTETPTLNGADSATASFIVDALSSGTSSVTHVFTLTVRDPAGQEATDTVTITIDPPGATTANAGQDRTVDSGAQVTLTGSGTAPGGTATYEWTRVNGSGEASVFSGTVTGETVSFTAEILTPGGPNATHDFRLTVTNSLNGDTAVSEVTITVDPPPLAEAGPNQTVASGMEVSLDGTGSRDNGGTVTYAWARTSGTQGRSVTLSNTNVAGPTFTAATLRSTNSPVTHVFTLTVTDVRSQTHTDTVTITITPPGAPTVNAGDDQIVASGAMVTLNGSGTSPQGTLAYRWMRTGGSSGDSVSLSDANALQPTFTADTLQPGGQSVTHEFTLTVTNPANNEAFNDTVTITVDAPPLADPGNDQNVAANTPVTLDGGGSSDDDGVASYVWTRTGGTGDETLWPGNPTVTGETVSFIADALLSGSEQVIHAFTLTVTDTRGQVHVSDPVTITVVPPGAPTANAGDDRTVASGSEVTLTGSGTAPGGTASYAWIRVGGTGVSSVFPIPVFGQTASFTAETLAPGDQTATYVFELTVINSLNGEAATDTVTITVAPRFLLTSSVAPSLKADAGPDRTVMPGNTVTLDGSGSMGDAGIIGYSWVRIGGTSTQLLSLRNTNTMQASFIADTLTPNNPSVTHVFRLTVTDGIGRTDTDEVTITIVPDSVLEPIQEFMETRNTILLTHQPDLSRLFRVADGGYFNFELTGDGLDGSGEFVSGAVWGEITGSKTNSDEADGGYLFMAYGAHVQVLDNFLAGAMMQYDQFEEVFAGGGSLYGSGWLAGPYFVAQPLAEHPLYFSGSLLYGKGSNDIVFYDNSLGRRIGSFDTQRLVANLEVEGEWTLLEDELAAENLRYTPLPYTLKLRPYAAGSFIKNEADGFTDNNDAKVRGQSLSLAQFDTGLRFSVPVEVAGERFNLNGGKGLVLSYIDSESGGDETEIRSRVELGYSYEAIGGWFVTLDGFYDGLYADGFENWGTTINVEKKF